MFELKRLPLVTRRGKGHPTKYAPGVGRKLVCLITSDLTVEKAAAKLSVHPATVYRWVESLTRRSLLERAGGVEGALSRASSP